MEHIEAVLELTTLVQGPREALVAAKVDFRDVSSAAQIEWACERAEQRLREAFPSVSRVYLDPTPRSAAATPVPPGSGDRPSSGRSSEG